MKNKKEKKKKKSSPLKIKSIASDLIKIKILFGCCLCAFNSKHVIEFTHLSHVIVVLTKLSQTEIREDPKGLPLGWGQFGAKASFSKMRVGVFK